MKGSESPAGASLVANAGPTANPLPINPSEVRYIKLGVGGCWEDWSLQEGVLSFGYHAIPHDVCANGDWHEVWRLLGDRKSQGAQTSGVTEVRAFYELGEDCLWVTVAQGHLWWTFANPEILYVCENNKQPSRLRATIGGWRKTDIKGQPLSVASLSSKLTKVGNYRGTICQVEAKDYLIRRINGLEEPIVVQANEARRALIDTATAMIRGLHWADFETLADLIFARGGWQRSTRVGEQLADVDILLDQPTTGETAFVQVKSLADQSVLNDYINRFRRSGHSRFFFICHSSRGTLVLPNEPNLHLFEGRALAQVAIRNGLYDWLIERSR